MFALPRPDLVGLPQSLLLLFAQCLPGGCTACPLWYQHRAEAQGITASWNRSGTSADDVIPALPREDRPKQVPQDRVRLGLALPRCSGQSFRVSLSQGCSFPCLWHVGRAEPRQFPGKVCWCSLSQGSGRVSSSLSAEGPEPGGQILSVLSVLGLFSF